MKSNDESLEIQFRLELMFEGLFFIQKSGNGWIDHSIDWEHWHDAGTDWMVAASLTLGEKIN